MNAPSPRGEPSATNCMPFRGPKRERNSRPLNSDNVSRKGGHDDQNPVVRSDRGLVDRLVLAGAFGEPHVDAHAGAQDASAASKSPHARNGPRGIELEPWAPDAACPSQPAYARER